MSKTKIKCAQCGGEGEKEIGEVRRSHRLGRKLYCSRTCAAEASNASRRSKEIPLECPVCGTPFVSSTRRRAKKHCSRACASKGSVNEVRRAAGRYAGKLNQANLLTPAEVLKRREAWKYAALREVLDAAGRKYEFEFPCAGYVFDLALLDVKVLVEFDGQYHGGQKQRKVDAKKTAAAEKKGYTVVRRVVESTTVVHPRVLDKL